MDYDDAKNQILFWLTEEGDFDNCMDRKELEYACSELFPWLYAALVAKRKAIRLFKFEIDSAR